MKYLIVFAAVIVAVLASKGYTPEQIQKIKTMTKECEDSTHVDHQKVLQFRKKQFDDHDEHLQDYMLCTFKKMHWMDDQGHLQKSDMKKYLRSVFNDISVMESCLEEHGNTKAATAYLIYKCILEHMPSEVTYPL